MKAGESVPVEVSEVGGAGVRRGAIDALNVIM
jgi:hypothetical protein